MSINTWTPTNALEKNLPDPHELNLAEWVRLGSLEDIETAVHNLEHTEIDRLTPLMKQPETYWQTAAAALDSQALWYLIRFFTVAEEQLSQLHAGKQSPVIAINRLLKQRQTPLSREQLVWIKSHTSNRFLPNGSIL